MKDLRDFTPARVALGRAGSGLPTRAHLEFQLAHARARDAVHHPLDAAALAHGLSTLGLPVVRAASAAPNRTVYLRNPNAGRTLNPASRASLTALHGNFDAVFLVADGLSALAVHRHAAPLLACLLPSLTGWSLAPIVVAEQARVALGDEIGSALGAAMSVVLIGERPGLSSPDSLGVYLTWSPAAGRTDAERNCISNIRPEGSPYSLAANRLLFLMNESRRRKLSGVPLKEEAALPPPA
jgi:ethanolamine ammonia-lyase small subunit